MGNVPADIIATSIWRPWHEHLLSTDVVAKEIRQRPDNLNNLTRNNAGGAKRQVSPLQPLQPSHALLSPIGREGYDPGGRGVAVELSRGRCRPSFHSIALHLEGPD